MDQRIYSKQIRNDFGVYNTHRFPKGGSVPGVLPTSPLDPNANPMTVSRDYTVGTIAPHTAAIRWTYTVPRNRRALLQSASSELLRKVAAAPVGHSEINIVVRRAGTLVNIPFVSARMRKNVVGDNVQADHSGPLELFEADTIEAISIDDSIGGSVDYSASVLMIEYDAVQKVSGFDIAGEQSPSANGSAAPAYSGIYYPAHQMYKG